MSTEQLTIGAIITKTIPFLAEKQIPNPRLEADLMLAKVLEQPRVKLYSEWDRVLKPNEVQQYREVILKRVQGWPLAYLAGKKAFLSWDFAVNPAVLIPRPETELVIEIIVEHIKRRTGLSKSELSDTGLSEMTIPSESPGSDIADPGAAAIFGIDVGTGSGVIAVTLAKLLPGSTWVATDISREALEVAKENASSLGVASQIEFIAGDLLEPLFDGEWSSRGRKFDIIVSNPPYIPSGEIASLQKEVRQEPILALDGGSDGLAVYRRLIPQAVRVLADDGMIVVEHGYNQRQPLEEIFKDSGLGSCSSYQDLAELERVLTARRIA